ncbi:MAG: recombinase family protein [Lachnospiraceae bacterium]|nr:recombinase family protein [Lachnospiraceae bacterium]
MEYPIVIAIYMRLSQDDGDFDTESNSIVNQRHLLHAYIAEHFEDYELLEFQDDGYTGTNFNRPGVSELLDKVREGRIDCIVVKDLSRFSRDYIETGSYLEHIFPFAGVRFIAINDGYDSGNHKGSVAGMDTSFINLMNDLYCKDISVKVKSALKAKKKKGLWANGSCTFGYCKDAKDRHKLLVVEEEAAIVRRIFRMTLDGVSSQKIAKQFNAEGVKTPMECKMERGVATMTPKGGHFEWDTSTICHMLRNATYAGDLVYDKYETPEVGGKSRIKPQSEWKVLKNHHEAIIDRDTFERIQQSRGIKNAVKYERHPLIGKMECGCCHKSLRIARGKNPYFFCGNRYVTRYKGCVYQVNVQFLEQYLLFRLQEESDKQADMQCALAKAKFEAQQKLAEVSERRNRNNEKLKGLQTAETRIYEAYALGLKGRNDYIKEKQEIQEQIKLCMDMQQELDGHIRIIKGKINGEKSDIYRDVQNHNLNELTQELADRFIKKIVVYDERNIEVEWNFPEKLPEELLQHHFAVM